MRFWDFCNVLFSILNYVFTYFSEQHRLISSQGSDCTVNSNGTIILGGLEGSEGTLFIDSLGSSGGNSDNRVRSFLSCIGSIFQGNFLQHELGI